jgi:hypothetical protein
MASAGDYATGFATGLGVLLACVLPILVFFKLPGEILEKITMSLGLIGISLPPIIGLVMKSKYDAATYTQVFYPVLIGFFLYMIYTMAYYRPNDDKLQSILILMACGSILFSLCAATLISIRMRYAA